MSEPAILEPIVYERVENDEGVLTGWKVPADELARWEAGSGRQTGEQPFKPKPLPWLIEELDRWLYLDSQLRARFEGFYGTQPERASRLAQHVIDGARDGSLQRPDAYLASRLRKET